MSIFHFARVNQHLGFEFRIVFSSIIYLFYVVHPKCQLVCIHVGWDPTLSAQFAAGNGKNLHNQLRGFCWALDCVML